MHSGNVYSIVTYHQGSLAREAAEAWKRDGIAAIGWSEYGDLRKPRRRLLDDWPNGARNRNAFLQIDKGDVVLAYSKHNMISYVGTVTKRYSGPLPENETSQEPFGYEHQVRSNGG